METGTSSQGSTSKKSQKKSTSSNPSLSPTIGTVSEPMTMDLIIQHLSDGTQRMKMETHISIENLLLQESALMYSRKDLTLTQTQQSSIRSLLVEIVGLKRAHSEMTSSLQQWQSS